MTDTGWTQTYSWMLSREIDGYELTVNNPILPRKPVKHWAVWTEFELIALGNSIMGWPVGWTDYGALEMDKFQQWQRLHGAC